MSVVNNIQGTLTQTQNVQQLQQQQGDAAKVQQTIGEVQNNKEQAEKSQTVNAQEDANPTRLENKKEGGQQQQKHKKGRKPTLDQQPQDENPGNLGLLGGGGLIDTQA